MQPGQRVSCVPGVQKIVFKKDLLRQAQAAYGEHAFDFAPRGYLLPEQYWLWRNAILNNDWADTKLCAAACCLLLPACCCCCQACCAAAPRAALPGMRRSSWRALLLAAAAARALCTSQRQGSDCCPPHPHPVRPPPAAGCSSATCTRARGWR
jgi:hypothetical protein